MMPVLNLPVTHCAAVIPAYNEARFIGSVVIEALQHVHRVLVVDDGSADSTVEIARSAGAEVLQLPNNQGKTNAICKGLHHIQKYSPDVIVMLDGDGQHDPQQIPQVIQPVVDGAADLVIGSRFVGIKSDIPHWRQVGQHGLTWVTNWASGVKSSDSQSGFRAFSAEIVPQLIFSGSGFSIESEMQFIAHEHNFRVAEVPISVVYAEPSKRNPFTHGLEVLNGIAKAVGQHRPLFFFGLTGSLLLIIGLLMGGWVTLIYQRTTTLAIGYALICVLCLVIGTSCISTGIILHSMRGWLLEWLAKSKLKE